MSEHIRERLSEFVDDEMSIEECDFFVRRLQLDEDARARFFRYHLIGTALRGEQSAVTTGAASSGASTSSPKLVRFGVAASIVLAAVIGLVSSNSSLLDSDMVEQSPLVGAQADTTGMQFLIHHMGSSPGLNRTLMHPGLFSIESDSDNAEEDLVE